jgi:para-nitrobenzyl esterase
VYRRTRPGEGDLFALIQSDHQYRRNNTRAAELKAAQGGAPAYMYEFTWKTPVLGGILRTPHTLCIPFVFGNCDIAGITGTDRYPLQDAMAAPGLRSRPAAIRITPACRAGSRSARASATMIFANPCALVNDPARDERLAMEQPARPTRSAR